MSGCEVVEVSTLPGFVTSVWFWAGLIVGSLVLGAMSARLSVRWLL